MKLSEIREAYEDLSGKLTDINRQLCFAGFAIIWIFNKSTGDFSVPQDLYLPAFLLCSALFADLLQYIVSSALWYIYYLKKRSNHNGDDSIEVDESEKLNIIPWLLFYLKSILLVVGYVFIGLFLISKL